MHVDEEQVQRLLHGELAEPARTTVARHVAECASCAMRVEEATRAERWLFDVLAEADSPVPAVEVDLLVRRARPRGRYWQRRAAAVLLAGAAATAAYAFPGSPMPGWMRSLGQRIVGTPDSSVPNRGSTPNPGAPAPGAGIAVLPSERLTIRFTAAQQSGVAIVTLTDSARVRVLALDARVTFTTGDGSITIDNAESQGDYVIEIPRQAPLVDVRVGDRVLLTSQRGQLAAAAGVHAERRAAGDLRVRLDRRDR